MTLHLKADADSNCLLMTILPSQLSATVRVLFSPTSHNLETVTSKRHALRLYNPDAKTEFILLLIGLGGDWRQSKNIMIR